MSDSKSKKSPPPPPVQAAATQETKDPSVFLILWLGVPAIAMIAYAWYVLNVR